MAEYYNMPIRILENVQFVEDIPMHNSLNKLQFLHVEVDVFECWDQFCETLDQCTNLKSLELSFNGEHFVKDTLPTLSSNRQNLWNKILDYLKKREIHIADLNEIYENEDLRRQLSKEEGIQ